MWRQPALKLCPASLLSVQHPSPDQTVIIVIIITLPKFASTIVLTNSVECTENTRPVLSVWKQEKHPFNGLHRLWLKRWGQKFWRPWPTPANFGHISKVFRHKLDKSAVDEMCFNKYVIQFQWKPKWDNALVWMQWLKAAVLAASKGASSFKILNGPLSSYTQWS